MYSMASFTVVIFSASSSGTSMPKASSKAITNSTWSSESAPRSSTNDAVGVTSASSTPSCSTIICFTRSSTLAIRIPPPRRCRDFFFSFHTRRRSFARQNRRFSPLWATCPFYARPTLGSTCLGQMHAAIDVQNVAGDVARLIAGQKHNRGGDVARRTHPPQRNPRLQFFLHLVRQNISHRRLDKSGRDSVHRDIPRSNLN